MANETTEPQGTPLVSQDMLDAQPTEEELRLPTNEELTAKEAENGNDGSDNQDGEGGEDTGDADGPPDAGGDSNPDESAQAPEAQVEAVEYVDDPGDFTPGDYSFEVMVYDQEGKNGKVHKIADLDAWDALLETEPNLGSSAAVLRAERAAQRMDRGVERDKRDYDARRAEYDEAVKAQEQRDATTLQWQQELDYLVNKGELPPMPAELHVSKANWKDPKVAGQPAVKAQLALLDYFRNENAQRAKVGLAPMTSLLDAYNGYARQQEQQQARSNRQAAATARKEAGGKVAASAPKPATTAPRGIAVGRVGVLD